MKETELVELACHAQQMAYAPHSNFPVGAVLECANGKIFSGCNIENATFGATICAERTAFATAIAAGERSFEKLLVKTNSSSFAPPCGICLQVIAEFCDANFQIILINNCNQTKRTTLSALFPNAFKL